MDGTAGLKRGVVTNGPRMKYVRHYHACGIVHSDKFEGRPLLVVAGAYFGDGQDKSEYWDFTVPGSQWQLCSKSFSFLLNIIVLACV